MTISSSSKKKPKTPKKVVTPKECCPYVKGCLRLLYKVPIAISFLVLICLWFSSTTIISGKIFHVCVSSRKLNSLYCLSAGTQPNFEIPIPLVGNNSTEIISGTNYTISSPIVVLDLNKETPNPTVDNTISLSSSFNDEDMKETPLSIVENDTTDSPIVNKEMKKEEDDLSMKEIKENMHVLRSWYPKKKRDDGCDGRGIYVYDLPSKFNKDLVGQCSDMVPYMDCNYISNEGFGEPILGLGKAWYRTNQYSLEPIFHSRVSNHPCRVHNESEAKLFFVPFYGGLDLMRWLFKNVSSNVTDLLGLELIKWLERKKAWNRNSGKDHVFVLGRISWDFRRREIDTWGTSFLELKQMQNPAKILIERQQWRENDIGVPYPTYFHPNTDNDIMTWQAKIMSSDRRNLVGFAGAARPNAPINIRSILIDQCTSVKDDKCKFLNCFGGGCDQPESVIELFAESEFCLQPPGDSATRRSVFDSLVSGCIPVIFDPLTAYYQYPWHLPEDHGKYSVFIDQEEVRQKGSNVVERLIKVSNKERDDMRRFIVYELLPGLVYGDPNSQLEQFEDAFSITINSLLERANGFGMGSS